MSITYGELSNNTQSSWIIFPGQLVRVKQNCFEQTGIYGIIIECACPDFGYTGSDSYLVLTEGTVSLIESFKIWPVEEQ